MYNEEEINDSLEFCRDIDIYYRRTREKNACKNFLKRKSYYGSYLTEKTTDSFKNNNVIIREESGAKESIFSNIWSTLGSLVLIVLLAYGMSSFITNYCVWHTQVDGTSMEPALENGDRLLVDKMSYHFREPERFDIVVFPQRIDVYYVKRIIGLPGETVQIKEGKIYINDVMLVENYGKEAMEESYTMELPVTLGTDQYFVLGDNRNHSMDSRDPLVGTVSKNYIIGKAWIIMYPKDRMHIFE